MSKLKIMKADSKAIIPTRGSEKSAGLDLYACLNEPAKIGPGLTKPIGTGIKMEIPDNYFGAIFARSGLASKEGLRPANCVGVVDSDYRGEVIVAVHNDSEETRYIQPGQRIAQMVIIPYLHADIEIADLLADTERGEHGFGSTGKQ